MKKSFRRNMVTSQLKWAGHVEQMEGEHLKKGADVFRVEDRKRRGRPGQRWEDCVKRDLSGMGWVKNESEG